jgi:hypothetical protein
MGWTFDTLSGDGNEVDNRVGFLFKHGPMTSLYPHRPSQFWNFNPCFKVVALIGLLLLSGALEASAASRSEPPPKVVPMGDNTYSIDLESNFRFARNTAKLKAQVREEAAKFCASQGKQLKVVSLTDEKPFWGADFIKARIVFKALDAGSPEILAAPKPAAAEEGENYIEELIKLDELRKKGIITDSEFKAQKKKILNRAK